jgi:hypothetical protein
LRVLAGPAGFDRDLFEALMAHFRTGYPPTRFPELCDLSIIEPGADGRWRLHALMRAHLLADLDPDLRRALHAFLFDWFDARCQPPSPREITPEHETALREAFDHRDSDDAEAALGWFWQRQRSSMTPPATGCWSRSIAAPWRWPRSGSAPSMPRPPPPSTTWPTAPGHQPPGRGRAADAPGAGHR